jgi:hypothetical protein
MRTARADEDAAMPEICEELGGGRLAGEFCSSAAKGFSVAPPDDAGCSRAIFRTCASTARPFMLLRVFGPR